MTSIKPQKPSYREEEADIMRRKIFDQRGTKRNNTQKHFLKERKKKEEDRPKQIV